MTLLIPIEPGQNLVLEQTTTDRLERSPRPPLSRAGPPIRRYAARSEPVNETSGFLAPVGGVPERWRVGSVRRADHNETDRRPEFVCRGA